MNGLIYLVCLCREFRVLKRCCHLQNPPCKLLKVGMYGRKGWGRQRRGRGRKKEGKTSMAGEKGARIKEIGEKEECKDRVKEKRGGKRHREVYPLSNPILTQD